jgi:hypothetical protein
VLALALAGCGDADVASAPRDAEQDAEDAGDAAPGQLPDDAGVEPARCRAPEGVSTSPHSIAEVVALLNALPKPVTLPCLLETLARPLALSATDSVFSLQPARGAKSPRIFLQFDGLILSVVPDGDGAPLLEMGERRSATTSLKAELAFPITAELDAAAPYVRLPFDENLTNCGVCHQGEVAAQDIAQPFATISQALRPRADQRVPLERVLAEARACDPSVEPERCAMLDALVAPLPGPIERDFPASYNTFF